MILVVLRGCIGPLPPPTRGFLPEVEAETPIDELRRRARLKVSGTHGQLSHFPMYMLM